MYRLLDIRLDKCFHNSILPIILSTDFIAGLRARENGDDSAV